MLRRRATSEGQKPAAWPARALPAGTQAPGFSLPSTRDEVVSLHQFKGRPVILVFYPADWSPVCGDQLTLYNEILPMFEEFDAQVLAVSVDGIWCHRAFAEHRHLRFPLLSDFEPKGAVARAYGAFDAANGFNRRALFVVGADGIIHWSYVSPPNVNPGADGILNALEAL